MGNEGRYAPPPPSFWPKSFTGFKSFKHSVIPCKFVTFFEAFGFGIGKPLYLAGWGQWKLKAFSLYDVVGMIYGGMM